MPILPYNAAANGTAEASVKRIKLLLDRHTKGCDEWHRVLPLAQLQLNSHVHTGTDMSPYMALFGRAPHGIAQLENPALLSKTGPGSDWLTSVRSTFLRMHSDIQKASDELKKARAAEANARTSSVNGTRTRLSWNTLVFPEHSPLSSCLARNNTNR